MRRITPAEIADRLRQAACARAERFAFVRERLAPPLREALVPGANPGEVIDRLARRVPTWAEGAEVREGPAPRDPASLRRIADDATRGRFDLLGLRALDFGDPPDWHREPTSGKRVPLVPWKRLDTLATDSSGNKKVVWELGRHHHLVTLSRAARHFGDARYGDAVAAQVASWLDANPPALGIHWTSSLELAFRAIAWLWVLPILGPDRARALPGDEMLRSLHAHGVHIERFLSTWSSPNTHLTGEALGLYYLGTCVPELRPAARWRDLGRKILVEALERHVRPDGVYFEQSTWYHRYTADFYAHFVLLARRQGERLPPAVEERLEALLEHLLWMARPDGTWPLLGDDDGGRLAALEERAPADWRALLATGAALFGRGDFRRAAGELTEETRWLYGPGADEAFGRAPPVEPPERSRAFPDGGYFVMRDGWRPDSHYLLVDCGPHGTMNCGHAHADALAIEVAVQGVPVIVDPGTYTYSSPVEERDRLRSSPAHSTVAVDGGSSSVPAGPFQWRHVARCTARSWHDHPSFTAFDGSHDGYRRLAAPVTHARAILFPEREYWVLVDRVEGEGAHAIEQVFQAAPGSVGSIGPAGRALRLEKGEAGLDIVQIAPVGAWSLSEARVSPCFGQAVDAPRAVFQVKVEGAAQVLAVLLPRAVGSREPVVADLGTARGLGARIDFGDRIDTLLWRSGAVESEGMDAGDFEWLWVRRTPGGELRRALLVNGSRARVGGVEVRLDGPSGFVVLAFGAGEVRVEGTSPGDVRLAAPEGIAIRRAPDARGPD